MEEWKQNLWVCFGAVFFVSIGMSQMAPILPLYIQHLGITDIHEIEEWSGLVFGANFISLAIFSPIWGKYADRYGRKPMVLRASLWLSIIMAGLGLAQTVWQLLLLRLVQGALSGFQGAVITLIATQTPKERAGWALGIIFTSQVSGALLGPLIGGYLAEIIGYRATFFLMSALCFCGFLAIFAFVKENFVRQPQKPLNTLAIWRSLPHPQLTLCLFLTTLVMQLALLSIEPIITVYIMHMAAHMDHLALIAGAVFACSGFASMLAAPRLGNLSDRLGAHKVLLISLLLASLSFIPQAFVTNPWQLGFLRFFLGIAAAGMLPSINTLIRQSTPPAITGRIYGFNQSAQFLGMFLGSILGGHVASAFGIRSLFFLTAALLFLNFIWFYRVYYRQHSLLLEQEK